ncbi:MAG: TonB-dependent receptor [Robiginitomaculum sp.]|nr:MAG: TonB-dependent receptor [Robiginitomaculum sp.]
MFKNTIAFKQAITGASALTLLMAAPALAQNSGPVLDEIIVTAQFRKAGLHDVPISMSAVDAKVIEESSIVKIEDLTTIVPNFTYTQTGISTNFFIRGVGSGINQGFEQSVGVYVDGVHHPRGQQVRAPFLDLERIEVLRGPQSILFGKNSVAGAMNITTARPTEEFEGSVLVQREFEDGESIVEAMLSGPISDRVRARIAGRYRDFDGYIENATLNRDEPNREEFTVRGTMEVDLSEDLMATFKVELSDFDSLGRNIEIENAQAVGGLTYGQVLFGLFGQDASVLNETRDGIRSSNGDSSNNKTRTYQMTLDWQVGDFNVQAISAYETLKYDEVCDCDFTGGNVFTADLQEQYKQFSQEIRLTSPVGDTFDYILGAYFQSSEHTYKDQIIVASNSILIPALGAPGGLLSNTQAARQANVDATVLSAFAQVNWHFQDNLTLQLGGRITNDNRDGDRVMDVVAIGGGAVPAAQAAAAIVFASGFGISSTNLNALGPTGSFFLGTLGAPQVTGERNVTKFSPDIKLVWDATDNAMFYASWARGFKSGGFDFRANNRGTYATAEDAFEFDDEQATNYEIGGKFKLGASAELNATAFFTKFDDLQISIFDGVLGFNVGNAATSEVKGLELDGRWAISDHVRLNGGMALTDFEFTDFKNGQCYFGQTPDFANGLCDYTGLSNQLVSKFSGNIGMDFDMQIGKDYEITGMANLFHASSYDAAATHDPNGVQDGFIKINARLGFGPQDGPWEIAVLAKNLTNEITRTYTGDAPLAGSSFGRKTNYSFFSQGRTIAVQGRLKF